MSSSENNNAGPEGDSRESQPVVDGASGSTPGDGVAMGHPVAMPTGSAHSGAGCVVTEAVGEEVDGWQRPSDFDIMKYQNELRSEVADKLPYVAEKEPLSALKLEYLEGNEVFVQKIEKLEKTFTHIRRTRGDGNCFFRAFLFSYIEGLMRDPDPEECSRFVACIHEWKGKLIESGYQEMVFEDALDHLVDTVEGINRPKDPMTQSNLESIFRDDVGSNLLVMLMRFITSAEVKRREEFFCPFIMGMYDDPPASVELFCQRNVEPMGEESDHIHIVALTDALNVLCRVVYLDRSGADMGAVRSSELDVTVHEFRPEACPAGAKVRATVLYRPGHYDVLY